MYKKIILLTLLVILVIGMSNLAYAQDSSENLNWFQKIVKFIVAIFTPFTETSTTTTQTENVTYRNLTPVTPANEPLAKPVEKIDDSQRHGIYINESEFYKDKKRTYEVGLPSHSFVPEPRKNQDAINYFKSLNLTDDYVYVLMQFEALGGDPSVEEMNILVADNITLFEYHGDHTYYARVPRKILETKSYDFVRWSGIVENATWKVVSRLRDQICDNCNGTIKLSIVLYENIENMPDYQAKIDTITNLSKKVSGQGREIINIETDKNNTYKIAAYNFVAKLEPVEVYRLT